MNTNNSQTDMRVGRASREPQRVNSPCVSICCLDGDDVCMGCYRTADEICDWGALGDDGKREILKKVEARELASGRLI